MSDWENDLRAALTTPPSPGRGEFYWHRPTDWTIAQAVEAVRPHCEPPMAVPDPCVAPAANETAMRGR